jgi:transposase-like protein
MRSCIDDAISGSGTNARGVSDLSYKLSYRDLVAMTAERGIELAHTTILRWVQHYTPEFEKRWKQ